VNIPQDFASFFFIAFCGVITLFTAVLSFVAYSIRDDFRAMGINLHVLAVNVASLTERLESLDARLEKLERISDH
jgi:Na+-transporting NADH:ubiquinone oxidoreductase subunit NqrE